MLLVLNMLISAWTLKLLPCPGIATITDSCRSCKNQPKWGAAHALYRWISWNTRPRNWTSSPQLCGVGANVPTNGTKKRLEISLNTANCERSQQIIKTIFQVLFIKLNSSVREMEDLWRSLAECSRICNPHSIDCLQHQLRLKISQSFVPRYSKDIPKHFA